MLFSAAEDAVAFSFFIALQVCMQRTMGGEGGGVGFPVGVLLLRGRGMSGRLGCWCGMGMGMGMGCLWGHGAMGPWGNARGMVPNAGEMLVLNCIVGVRGRLGVCWGIMLKGGAGVLGNVN